MSGNDDGVVEEIDAGDWESGEPEGPQEGPKKHIDDTRATFAYLIFWLLAGIFLFLFALLFFEKLSADEFQKVAAVTISPVVGLVGAVSGYYYGRSGRGT